jgi:hypothetical protein
LEAQKIIPATLRTELEYYFGSVKGAKLALKTEPRFVNGWSKQKIMDMIARKHRAKESLSYATGRREFPALVSAAESYLGAGGTPSMPLASTQTCILFITHGANASKHLENFSLTLVKEYLGRSTCVRLSLK